MSTTRFWLWMTLAFGLGCVMGAMAILVLAAMLAAATSYAG